MMMRSPGRAFSEALVVAFVVLPPFAELVLAVALGAGVFLAVDVFLVLVFLAVVLLAGTVCLPAASVSISLLLQLQRRSCARTPVAIRSSLKACASQDAEPMPLSPVLDFRLNDAKK
jgi:hypothetical protein